MDDDTTKRGTAGGPLDTGRRALLLGGAASLALRPLRGRAQHGFPRTVTDTLGRQVLVPAWPRRIVAVFPSNIEIAFALGLGDRIAAIGGRVRWPAEALVKPSIGGALGYSPEVVAGHAPDLIVVTPSHQSAVGLIAPFERIGVPVLVLQHPDIVAILRNIRLLAQATATEVAADALVENFERALADIARRLAGRPRRTVYLETAAAARGAFQTVGAGHYANDALGLAGGHNVFDDLRGSQQVSGEAVLLRNPEAIISLQQVPKSAERIAERPGWASLRAVRDGRIAVLERGHKLIPGPRQLEAVLAYAQTLHPECFEDAR